MPTLGINIFETPKAVVIQLSGQAGYEAVDGLQVPFQRVVVARPRLVVLDLAGLDFAASLFLGMVVNLRRGIVMQGGQVQMAGVRPNLREILQVSKLDALFEFIDAAPQPAM
jgi:anti-anti-sigma factor